MILPAGCPSLGSEKVTCFSFKYWCTLLDFLLLLILLNVFIGIELTTHRINPLEVHN